MRLKISQFLLSVAIASALMLGGCSTQQVTSNTSSPTSTATSNASEASTKTTTEATSVSQSKESVPGFANLPRLQGKATVVLTVKGSPITIEVDGTNAPITAGNFVDLVQKGVYNGLVFHRVERGTPEQPQPFVVQGGDPQSKDPNFPVDQLGTGSYIDPKTGNARYIPLEIQQKGSNTPIYNQTFDATAQPVVLPHKLGAVAMARSQPPDSASSQFYFALADIGFLDGKYAVFGNVTQGFDVVNKIQQGDRIDSAKVTQGAENLKTPGQ